MPGQISFFEDRGNLNGFEPKMKTALDLAVGWGYAQSRRGFDPGNLDYKKIAELARIEYSRPSSEGGRFRAEGVDVFPDSDSLDDRTIVSFTISFEPNDPNFSADRYGAEFSRALQSASTFGHAVVVVRGHADPTTTLVDLMRGGLDRKIIKQTGQSGAYQYFLDGKPLDLTQTEQIVKLVTSGAFESPDHKPRQTMQAALNLSLARAEAVKQSIAEFAREQGVNLDTSQIQPVGAGITEPVIAKPRNLDDAKQNMRVEFRIVRVPAEALNESDFNF
jgi:hypothetical protein